MMARMDETALECQERLELNRARAAAQRSGNLRVFTWGGTEIAYDENDQPMALDQVKKADQA
jgi:hypothetical protein